MISVVAVGPVSDHRPASAARRLWHAVAEALMDLTQLPIEPEAPELVDVVRQRQEQPPCSR
jgi:hypothetical protein